MSRLKTLRATPHKNFQKFHLSYEFMQSQVKYYGQTAGLRRSREKIDYFDIEFDTREDADATLKGCVIDRMDLAWAPNNIKKKEQSVLAIASYQSPLFDYKECSEVPSVPMPSNNPHITKWALPEKQNPTDKQEPAKCYYPSSIQIEEAVDPGDPFKERIWPGLPIYTEEFPKW